jgi:UDP-N-acetylglucosamine 2-epimerase (non-hydrolysing)
MKIIIVAGARPNFMKISPIIKEIQKSKNIEYFLVHTGQHYDKKMSDLFFEELGIPQPDINLGVGSASHAVQTANIMKLFEPVVIDFRPDAIMVVGDVNSTIACGLVAVKMGIKLMHVEAGLRSFDRTMPEEINRILTDSISDYLFCTETDAVNNLLNEGVPKEKTFLVGDVMIDTLLQNVNKSKDSNILEINNISENNFCFLTLHRPSNVDNIKTLNNIFDAVEMIQKDIIVIFSIHPRTRKNLVLFKMEEKIKKYKNLRIIEPVGYLDCLKLISSSKFVMTDSGGIQGDCGVLKIPCLTLRETTERPIIVKLGLNKLVGSNTEKIINSYKDICKNNYRDIKTPDLWDGKAAQRIVKILEDRYVRS